MPTKGCRASVLDDVGDQFAPIGSQPWAKWMLGQAKLRRRDLDDDVAGLKSLIVGKLEKHDAWKVLGFDSLAALCRKELSLDEEALKLLRTAKPGTTLRVVLEAESPKELKTVGRPDKTLSDNNSPRSQGTSAEYLTARIARDHPDILKRMKDGEFKSVRAAAIEAGIVKTKTALDSLKKAWAKATPAEKKEFLRFIEG